MKVGILGAGSIAGKMAWTIQKMADMECYAVASRSKERGEKFKEEYGFQKVYTSYEEMVKDDAVELIYVATPHNFHYEHTLLCLKHKKPVLCEKPFMPNCLQVEKIYELAKKNNTFVSEAIWTRYMPSAVEMKRIIDSGLIGEVTSVEANLGYYLKDKKRLCDPALAGGALLDLGVYTINFAFLILGSDYKDVKSCVIKTEEGVDAMHSITLVYSEGKMATLHSTFYARTNRLGIISGTNGYMEIQNINNCEQIRVYNTQDALILKKDFSDQITGFEYEVEACARAIREGKLECPEMPHRETMKVTKLMDHLREEWGIVYPFEKGYEGGKYETEE